MKAISEGLRAKMAEHNIQVTTLYPGAVASELKFSSSDPESRTRTQKFYAENESGADAMYALEQPEDVSVNELTIRPTRQVF